MHPIIFNILFLNFILDPRYKIRTVNDKIIEPISGSVCYYLYIDKACFSLDEFWTRGSRPIAKLPLTPQKIDTQMYLYSNSNFSFPEILNPENAFSLMNSPINKNRTIFILAHGFLSSRRASWIRDIIGELLRADEENIILVDWSKGAKPPYTQAIANLRLVSVQLAQFIYSLIRFVDIPPSSFHLIGHSLGAHLLGLTGGYMQEIYNYTLPRITALDPAGALFNESHTNTRLDASDAEFVDVIHTSNSLILGFPLSVGMITPIGDVDFYPNGGGSQPECHGDLTCHHYRASKLFIESIRQSCTFIGVQCTSYEEYLQGECWGCHGHPCPEMGFKAKKLNELQRGAKYFLLTKGNSPYCGSQFRITLKSSNESVAWDHGGEFAVVSIQLNGARDSTTSIQLSENSVFYEAGSEYHRVILAPNVGDLVSLSLLFNYDGSLLSPISWRIGGLSLYFISVTVEQLQPSRSWKFCLPKPKVSFNQKLKLTKKNLC